MKLSNVPVAKATQTALTKLIKCCTISYTIEFGSAAARPT